MCHPYIESATTLSDIYMDTNTDHFTPLVLRVQGDYQIKNLVLLV